jgi:catechol 2,3-dioxygenase-like lactoylglutathione lyase family enzyme
MHRIPDVEGPGRTPKLGRGLYHLPLGKRLFSSRRSCRTVADEGAMKRTWTIIGVADVPGSFKWYQSLLGLPETAPAHDYFGQILDSDGTVLLCLHKWGAHEHPSLTSPSYAEPGNGLLLFFRIDNFDEALPRARALVSRLDEEPHVNPSTGTAEFSLRDPDGYYVTLSALDAA